MSEFKPVKITVIFVLILLVFRAGYQYFTDPSVYRGPWYTARVPAGWEKKLSPDEMMLLSPERDSLTEIPEAIFSVYTHQSTGALFIEDLMQDVDEALSRADGRVLDKGEIKIDGEVAKWVLFLNNDPPMTVLTFYVVDDFNRLTKIQFSAMAERFQDYRPVFEQWKDDFRFKKAF